MAKVNICNVRVLDNPSPFLNPFQFEITFECLEDLSEDLEWKIIYVGAAESEEYDQTLDSVLVGPVPGGRHIAKEFIRVGYYVNNEYQDQELKENPPSSPIYSKLERSILATQPRVTRFKIDWDDNSSETVENAENIPPAQNPDSESNQMSIDNKDNVFMKAEIPAGAVSADSSDIVNLGLTIQDSNMQTE
ncbi:hypothetical protein KUTeg_016985 [Tegillarca granosa]|uniref:Uncharacterized protein n=1 Tax=Tegillarca granosa TaxID=220873 RepID=A0ABQ9EMP0_TEGGR|nr:hypothetical protein KUTeg_016985 [Tegillarca granosa]